MYELRDIEKTFEGGAKVLDRFNLKVDRGEIVALLGLSGAGKSTALRTLNLLERPDSGQVLHGGIDLLTKNSQELRFERRKIGIIFQGFHLLQQLNVYDNVAFPLRLVGTSEKEIRTRVLECLELVRLSHKVTSYPSRLSGGEKQRVAIARAVVTNPGLLLADEPTSALDPLTKAEVLRCLSDVNRDLGVSIVIATHEISVVRNLCHRAILLKDGREHEKLLVRDGVVTAHTDFGREFLEFA